METSNATRHLPVLRREILEMLAPAIEHSANPRALDCTLGGAGHSEALLATFDGLFLVAIDRDPAAIGRAKQRLARFSERYYLIEDCFGRASEALTGLPPDVSQRISAGAVLSPQFSAILLDAGLSSDQLDDPSRGFTFSTNGPLDMRMSPSAELTAEEVLNQYSFNQLLGVFRRGGVGANSRALANAVIDSRPLHDTSGFQAICRSVAQRANRKKRSQPKSNHNPATVPFQALRIEVNNELAELKNFFASALELLEPGGRLAVISFQSLEDQIAAKAMRSWSRPLVDPRHLPPTAMQQLTGKLLTKQAVVASEEEIELNPRSRSARLRVFEKH